LVIVREPPPPPRSANFYRADLTSYLNTQVQVEVASVAKIDASSPDGFLPVRLETGPANANGGSITAYIPEAFYDSFLEYYQSSGREFTGLLYQRDNEVILVYPRQ
jgi:hypothetical protein